MYIVVTILILLAAHFCLTAFTPNPIGEAHVYWPWTLNSRPFFRTSGGLWQENSSLITLTLASIAGLCLIGAAAALVGLGVPANLWLPLIVVGAVASIALFILYLSPLSLIPIAVDLILLWGVLLQQWTVFGLRGS